MGRRRKNRRNGEDGGSSLPPVSVLAHESPDFIAIATSDYLPPDLYLVGFSGADLLEAPIDEGGNLFVEDVITEVEAVRQVHRMSFVQFMQVPEVPGFVELCLYRGAPELSGYGADREATLSLMSLCFQIRLAVYRDALRAALRQPALRFVNRPTAMEWLGHLEASTFLIGMEPFGA